ncbi:hypothetical protein G7009_07000 [Pseudomonas capeferrum]|uniref:hypothetical protein n=1 Tax=Pseudomonas capeferrum TaxID=1495066 RepID=UPI0015E3F129|nr:hypothetical protein [Pseudomonas capeferrum]MBA1201507.1 hypothetical protein [Pseudomonas capeferrum]
MNVKLRTGYQSSPRRSSKRDNSDETFTARCRLVEGNTIHLFTRYPIEATIGSLSECPARFDPLAITVQPHPEPKANPQASSEVRLEEYIARMKRAPRGI